MPEPTTTHTQDVPGAVLTYDVRPSDSGTKRDEPILLMIGSPMGASGFAALAGYFADRTVVTYDPRGVERSTRTDSATEATPELHADDLHRLIAALGERWALGAGPVDVFASSGGAINALALVARHPEQFRTLVAHEPPAFQCVPDCAAALAAAVDIRETYRQQGFGLAMAKFLVLLTHKGELPADFASRPPPDPAMFGLPTEDDGSRGDPLLEQNMVTCTHYHPDFAALKQAVAAGMRIVVGIGADSEGELAHRAAAGVAQRLGTAPVAFPGGHGGFAAGEDSDTAAPAAFAATLRGVLTAKG